MRNIRFLNKEDLPEYLPIYLNSYPANKSIGDDGYEKYYERCSEIMDKDKSTHYVGLFENDILIAIMKIIDFQMNYFGKTEKATGLMSLGVAPLHKRKGAALDMVKFFEEYSKNIGASVALLLPFRIDFYRKMGYGFITRLYEYHLDTTKLPSITDQTKFKILSKNDFHKVIDCYTEVSQNYHGMIQKFGEESRDMERDSQVRRIGYFEKDKLLGYVAFNFKSDSDVNYTKNLIDVSELIYANSTVLRELLGVIGLQSDLAQKVTIRTGEPDFYHLINDPSDVNENYIDFGYLETNISAVGVMGKIVDYDNFLYITAKRKFIPLEMSVRFKTKDELTKKELIIDIDFIKDETEQFSTWKKANSNDFTCEITCSEGDLSALLFGGLRFGSMYRLGLCTIDKAEYVNILDSLLCCYQQPFTNTDF